MSWAQRLVLLWLAQNVFLTGSALYRLCLYVSAYSLTRFRIAAGVWMGLVAFGLAAIAWRVIRHRTNTWLVAANLAAAGLVLFGCCYLDLCGIVAWYNVRHCRELRGTGVSLDVRYLERLGPAALPAVRWFSDQDRAAAAAVVAAPVADRLASRLATSLQDWRAWTWRRGRWLKDEERRSHARTGTPVAGTGGRPANGTGSPPRSRRPRPLASDGAAPDRGLGATHAATPG
jgi:hypothetical protein